MKMKFKGILFGLLFSIPIYTLLVWASIGWGATYYVRNAGNDGATGLSATTNASSGAWQTISKVNSGGFSPGDSILLNRGDTWREQLTVPNSGTAGNLITFGAYGTGAKPRIFGSIQLVAATWTYHAPAAWQTVQNLSTSAEKTDSKYQDIRQVIPANTASYNGTKIRVTLKASASVNLVVGGTSVGVSTANDDFNAAPTRITWDGGTNGTTVTAGATKVSDEITFSLDKTKRLLFEGHFTARNWASYIDAGNGVYYSDSSSTPTTDETMTQSVTFNTGGNTAPFIKTEIYVPSLDVATYSTPITNTDIGNVILNGEASTGVKRNTQSELANQGDFWYDSTNHLLYIASSSDPASFYTSIEAALNQDGVLVDGKDFVTIQNFDIRYVGIHGVEVLGYTTSADNVTVEHCDISFIGGAYQSGTTRYGNGIQYYDDSTNGTIRYNRIDNVFDGGITIQDGKASTLTGHQVYYNIVSRSEYGLELGAINASSTLSNIGIYNNDFYNSGGGFGHSQRPDPSGNGLQIWGISNTPSSVSFRNNIVHTYTNRAVFRSTATLPGITLDYNDYYPDGATAFEYGSGSTYTFANWKIQTSQDAHSPTPSDPLFVSPSTGDFHLQWGSPAIDKGIGVGLTLDYAGQYVPVGNGPDIGAYEYYLFTTGAFTGGTCAGCRF